MYNIIMIKTNTVMMKSSEVLERISAMMGRDGGYDHHHVNGSLLFDDRAGHRSMPPHWVANLSGTELEVEIGRAHV